MYQNNVYNLMLRFGFALIIIISLTVALFAQDDIYLEDYNYVETIQSVKFTKINLQNSLPILLGPNDRLRLQFDEIGNEQRYLRYIIQHCNRDWTISQLTETEFLDGFNDEELRTLSFSINTSVPYIHYELNIPNINTRLKKSGNYLIHIYDEVTEEFILTRRFFVVDPILNVRGNVSRATQVDQLRTHQEVDFYVKVKDMAIRDPQQEIKATIIQNGRWDHAITDVIPNLLLGDELSFDYQGKITFPAGREFRTFDIRTLEFSARNIDDIRRYRNSIEVQASMDKRDGYQKNKVPNDLNGTYILINDDFNGTNLNSEYVFGLFSLYAPQEYAEGDIYIVGEFNLWQHIENNKMTYSEEHNAYFGEVLLKQGLYDYAYSVANNPDDPIDLTTVDGNDHETANWYTILIYYRPFGARFDQLIGATLINEI